MDLVEREKLMDVIKEIAIDATIRGKHKAVLTLYEKLSSLDEYRAFIKDYIECVERDKRTKK